MNEVQYKIQNNIEQRQLGRKLDQINYVLQHPGEGEIKTSLSIGIAFSESGYTDELFNRADKALYRTKENGRCGYSVYQRYRIENKSQFTVMGRTRGFHTDSSYGDIPGFWKEHPELRAKDLTR